MKIIILIISCFYCLSNGATNHRPPKSHLIKHYINSKYISLFANYSLYEENSQIDTVIISLHGTLRNGQEYFKDMIQSIGEKIKTTLVIAPSYKREGDDIDKDEYYWGRRWYQKWKYGYLAQNSDRVGSFHVMDHLIKTLNNLDSFPNLKSIILIGHSAGGQFIQRYAVGTKINSEITVELKLVVSNPSSYLYLHPNRLQFINGDFNEVETPNKNCPEYNDYIYGINNLPSYFENQSFSELKRNFQRNPVTYLMSEEDKETDYLDRSCEANLQGKNRIDRAYNFFQYLRKYFPDHRHQFSSIPHIGHDHLKVFSSDEALKLFFQEKNRSQQLIINDVGNAQDKITTPKQAYILLGGGKNDSEAFKYLLNAANGGDILVLSTKSKINHRYTHYLWKLAEVNNIEINSITTVSTPSRNLAQKDEVNALLEKADAIFLTGGDQYRYQEYWKNTKLLDLLHEKINHGTPLAGSSAGLAIMGEYYFSAKNGTIYSLEALRNPESSKITIEENLLPINLLENVITDTHFSERNREGRLLAFMSKANDQFHTQSIGIGVDEATSLIVENEKMTKAGTGNVYIYKPQDSQKSGLNFGPIKKFTLNKSTTYPPLEKIVEDYKIIRVQNGIVK